MEIKTRRFLTLAILCIFIKAVRSQTPPPLAPTHGALLGLYYGDGTLPATDALIGRRPQIHLTYRPLTDDWTPIAARDIADGRVPLISWEPDGVDFHRIVGGAFDALLRQRAEQVKALGKTVVIDFAAEMNSDEAWSKHDAPLYIAGFRHIHDLFVAAGATNVVWAWCPNIADSDGSNDHTMDYYPGDAYVDWLGVDGYNWPRHYNARWTSFADLFARIYPLLAAHGKPILIGEMGTSETGGDKAAWIDGIVPALKTKYPLIKAIVWFDVNKETDWRLNSSAASAAAFRRMANDPYFNP